MEHIYRSFYTKSDPISKYMVSQLNIIPGVSILEPCAGDGVFIDAILKTQNSVHIAAYEINPDACDLIKQKYKKNQNVDLKFSDYLFDMELDSKVARRDGFDRIIANPPYGSWQDHSRRSDLKKKFKGLYVKESYALFLYWSIQLLKEKGTLVFIIPDTYLCLHMHKKLRKEILTKTKIMEIALFPSNFFPGVNFGYSNLSIITVQKCSSNDERENNDVSILSGIKRPEDLMKIKSNQKLKYNQKDIFNSMDHALFVSDNISTMRFLNEAETRIGDIADCVTGFYSGNDKKFLRVANKKIKNAKNYKMVVGSKISSDYSLQKNILHGIHNGHPFIPIVKGGGTKYFKPDNWFIDWSSSAVDHYRSDTKARFQNPDYYFKKGVGVPMVSSKQITAAIIENRVFDQSIVGIFPKDDQHLYFLLAFFNSPICNFMIRTINISTNNSANYIKKIPFMKPSSKQLKKVDRLTRKIIDSVKLSGSYRASDELELHDIFSDLYRFEP